MTRIYLINNSLTMNNLAFPLRDSLEAKREKRILSIEGEKESEALASFQELQGVSEIFASSYVMSIATAKYLSQKLELPLQIEASIGEQVIGNLGDKKLRIIREQQENNFDFKLNGGESLNDVKKRMLKFINMILSKYKNRDIAVFSHNVAITCLLSQYCDKGFNLDNRLILNFKEEAIVDGAWDGISVIELQFEGNELINITRKK